MSRNGKETVERKGSSRKPSSSVMANRPILSKNSLNSNSNVGISQRGDNGSEDAVAIDINNPDPEVVDIVARHLRTDSNSLQTPGGDITRDLYKWTNENLSSSYMNTSNNNPIAITHNGTPPMTHISNIPSHQQSPMHNNTTMGMNLNGSPIINSMDARRKRSMSFSALSVNSEALNNMVTIPNPRLQAYEAIKGDNSNNNIINQNIDNTINPQLPSLSMTHEEIRAPGGFRRSYIIRRRRNKNINSSPPNFITRNFIEFLTLYGHFAGENLSESEDEEEEEGEEGIESGEYIEEEAIESETEATTLIQSNISKPKHLTSTVKAVLLLLKSFVGTGVLFLPKAFHNGGWGFSSLCLLFCAVVSYYCFVLLIVTKDKVGVNGYGEMGAKLYGHKMKLAILSSIALSQIGFAAAYTVFTATNLKVFVENIMGLDNDAIGLGIYIWLQALIFIPLALTRNIAKLSGTALIADLFILLGLVYVYYYATYYVLKNGIASNTMVWFNKSDWSLFIGTAIFTFEGIGLLIPIQESMKHPDSFQKSLSGVMIVVTIIFISCGLLCYSAFGSHVETVVLLNFPQDTYYTAIVQLLYALAILLSTPLQLFPAIRILEQWTFPSNLSGKHNPKVKWLKNYFRCGVVIGTTILAWVGANDLDKFVSLVGSLACIPLIYIHPPLLHYKASKMGLQSSYSSSTTSSTAMYLDLVICVFGITVMAYTSWQTISMWLFN